MTNLKTITALSFVLALTPAALTAAEGGPGLFDVNLGLSLWTVVIFGALLILLRKYAWGPILGMVEERENRIQAALDESAESREEAAKLLEEHRAQLADARRQASDIIAEGKAAGEKVRKDIEEKARGEAQAIVESARREIQREKEQALDELRRESVDLALAAASRLLDERLDSDRDRQFVMDYLKALRSDQGVQA
ncbi:MAG: F0F1 ATP synthase subunit B [Gemmatimonadales bacterium]|nr:MAG: F0F1 ATP synthase subunit B [Gemmatimonadales bacterium]